MIYSGGHEMKKRSFDWSKYGICLAWILMVIVISLVNSNFLSTTNILNILRQVSIIGICSVGMAFVILSGGIDLSLGSMVGVSGVSCALLLTNGVNPIVSILISILIGAVSGLIIAFFINVCELIPFIVTMGMMTTLRGVAYVLTNGMPIHGIPDSIGFIGKGYLFDIIPFPVILLIIVFILGIFILEKTTFGRIVYGIGGNIEASRLSGINVKKQIYMIYMLAGMLFSLAGIVLLGRINSGQPTAGNGYEMDAITACVLGGISFTGGEGRLIGVVMGLLIIGTLTNGMTLMSIPEFWQWVVKGIVLILAVSIDTLTKKRKAR
jgi:ribose transport system permease protein